MKFMLFVLPTVPGTLEERQNLRPIGRNNEYTDLAARTERIKFASLGLVLPACDPLRVAVLALERPSASQKTMTSIRCSPTRHCRLRNSRSSACAG
jgi:hypothetical protein